jgi:uroporphyrin-III C-methyltransferase
MPKAFIVGAGPGDPDLLTIAAAKALKLADVVLYDRLVSADILALTRANAVCIDVGKKAGEQAEKQKVIFDYFDRFADSDKTIVRLKGGDPYVFGRGFEEYVYLLHLGFDVKVIPGITSAIAVPELAGIPVTARGISRGFAVITGHCCAGCGVDWPKYAGVDTLIILMGVEERVSIARALLESGRPGAEPIAFIENGSLPNERVVRARLIDVINGQVDVSGPAIFVVGEVAALNADANLSYDDYGFSEKRQRLQVIA